jgi:hypothetical protein
MINHDDRITVDVNEGSRITGLSRAYLYILMKEGRLTKRKVGNRTLLLVSDLRNLVGADAA